MRDGSGVVAVGLVLAVCLVASYFDVRSRRIPNWLTGSLAIAAVAVHAFAGFRVLALSLAVMAVMTVAATLLYSRGGIGGGDLKLAIAGSGMLSFPLCVPFLLYTMLGGGVLAIAFMLRRGDARQSVSHVATIALSGMRPAVTAKSQSLPYAVAFAFGALLTALAQTVAPFLRIVS